MRPINLSKMRQGPTNYPFCLQSQLNVFFTPLVFILCRPRFASLALLRVAHLERMGTFQKGAHCFNSLMKLDVPLYEVCNWVILVFEIVTHVGGESENSGIVFALSLTSPCVLKLVSGTRYSECFGGGRKLLHHQLPRSASEDDRISSICHWQKQK